MTADDLLDLMLRRRSIRRYTEGRIPEDTLQRVLQAGLLGPSACNKRNYELLAIRDRETLRSLIGCRASGPAMLKEADALILVLGDPAVSDTWIEDGAIALTQMHLMATALGLGSCWIQGRERLAADGSAATDFLRRRLGWPEGYIVEGMLCLGFPAEEKVPYRPEALPTEKIHLDTF